jgi:DNA polymerase-1
MTDQSGNRSLVACYDTESDGLLHELTKLHCLAINFIGEGHPLDGKLLDFADQPGYRPIREGLELLATADIRVAHNGQGHDEPAIAKVYPEFRCKEGSALLDTLLLSRLVYPDIRKQGPNTHRLPGGLRKSHGQKAWGLRLGEPKDEYNDGWDSWSPKMHSYMIQDVKTLTRIFRHLISQKPSKIASALEHDFAAIIRRQEARGFAFDMGKALVLLAKLEQREQGLEAELIQFYGQWWEGGKRANPKAAKPFAAAKDDEDQEFAEVDDVERLAAIEQRLSWGDVITVRETRRVKMLGQPNVTRPRFSKTGKALKAYVGPPVIEYEAGAQYTPIKRVEFNPSSREHVRKMLRQRHGWVPTKFTPATKNYPHGQAVVDDDVLKALPWPETQKLAEYYLVLKRLGQLATGKKAWIKLAVEETLADGRKVYRIHGQVNTNGATSGRCTHYNPNMTQVPKVTAEYGWECRDLFYAVEPHEEIGHDASSLELCMMGHYIFRWDGGEYCRIVNEGKPHAWLRDLIGTDLMGEGAVGYDHAKTTIYAYIYGAGNEKLGSIVQPHASTKEKLKLGAQIREKIGFRFTALAELTKAIEATVESKGYLTGLDGRKLRIRKKHAALNLLLQSAGAIVMKQALVILDRTLADHGLKHGLDYEFLVNAHDEAQAEVLPEKREKYIELALASVPAAGLLLKVKCPLKAEAKTGRTWAECH